MNGSLRSTRLGALFGTAAIVFAACGGAASAPPAASPTQAAASVTPSAASVSFKLTYGILNSFTGDLSVVGPPWDKAARLGVQTINDALVATGLQNSITIDAKTEDDTGNGTAAAEAATKLIKIDGATVIIGPCCSGVTVAIGTATTIPAGIPVFTMGTSPTVTALVDNGTVFRTVPSDALQGQVLAQVVAKALGTGAKVNIGARNDDYGTGLSGTFAAAYEALGGTVGETVLWNPEATSFDTDAQKVVSGDPAGWVFFEYSGTWPKIQPALERTGKWDAARSFGGDTFSDSEATPAGMHGTIATVKGGTGYPFFKAAWDASPITDVKYYGSFEPQAFDDVIVAFLAALAAGSSDPAKITENVNRVANAPGTQYGPDKLADAIKAVLAGDDIDYIGATGPVDFDANGDPTIALFDVWQATGGGKQTVVETVSFGK